MDPRVREHAEIIVDHSVDVGPDDEVLLRGHPVAEDLMIAIAELCGERGANLSVRSSSSRVDRAYRKAIDVEDISQSAVSLAGAEATDVAIAVRADANTFETSDIDPEKTSVMARVNKEIQEEMMGKRWVGTQYPAPANAQDAEMSTDAYESFVWGAINKNWAAVREHQAQMVEILDPAEAVRIRSGEETDITMSVAGNPTQNDFAERKLGIGMNRDIDQFTYNMLFDEKMGDTVHMALGRAYEDTVGEANERNDSSMHMDMIVDMSEDSTIEVDGEVVQRDGAFVFEDHFE